MIPLPKYTFPLSLTKKGLQYLQEELLTGKSRTYELLVKRFDKTFKFAYKKPINNYKDKVKMEE
jgi:hypothetical protein